VAVGRFREGSPPEQEARPAQSPGAGRTGSVNVNVEPWPGSLLTQIRPPCSSMNLRDSARPSPVELLEQPHVLDRDHRLVGERLEQGDLRYREWARLRPIHDDRSDRAAVA
jgi:hypothetical protein